MKVTFEEDFEKVEGPLPEGIGSWDAGIACKKCRVVHFPEDKDYGIDEFLAEHTVCDQLFTAARDPDEESVILVSRLRRKQ